MVGSDASCVRCDVDKDWMRLVHEEADMRHGQTLTLRMTLTSHSDHSLESHITRHKFGLHVYHALVILDTMTVMAILGQYVACSHVARFTYKLQTYSLWGISYYVLLTYIDTKVFSDFVLML